MIIELKWDKDADSAIRQIKERRYTGNLRGYGFSILLKLARLIIIIEEDNQLCVMKIYHMRFVG